MIIKAALHSAIFMAAAAIPLAASAQEAGSSAQASARADQHEVEGIARLVQVWGFVKHHHPDARTGDLAMDPEFLKLYPQVRSAASLADVDALLAGWLDAIGEGAPCDPCVQAVAPEMIAIPSTTSQWLETLPASLATPLKRMNENRGGEPSTFNVVKAPGVGNPVFPNEPDYTGAGRLDEEGVHLLGLARQWNVLRYFFPYRDIMDASPDAILNGAIRDFLADETEAERRLSRQRLTAKSNDGHGLILSYDRERARANECISPHGWRFAEGRLVIDERAASGSDLLRPGDVVTAIDGTEIAALTGALRPAISASNEDYLELRLASRLMVGNCGEKRIAIERGGQDMEVSVNWIAKDEAGFDPWPSSTTQGVTIEQLPGGITYVRFGQLKRDMVSELVETANAGRGLILDMRGYVSDFTVFELGQHLVDEETPFVRFTAVDIATPGQVLWGSQVSLSPDPEGQRLAVPVVALINAMAASSPEYHAQAFRAGGAVLIGSPTAGADGNVSQMPLPDGAAMRFSGIGVYYPDGSPTQRVGIVPDILVEPTIAGIKAGRDEVLERALAELRSKGNGQP